MPEKRVRLPNGVTKVISIAKNGDKKITYFDKTGKKIK